MKPASIVEQASGFPDSPANYRYLGVFGNGGLVQIVLLLPDNPVRALPDRTRMARRHFVRILGTRSPRDRAPKKEVPRFGFDLDREEELLEVVEKLDDRLAGIFEAPLAAKYVDMLLGITARERRRWSKNGRLRPCGYRSSTRTSSRFNLPEFAVDLIERLQQNPQIIAEWREEDRRAERAGPGRLSDENSTHAHVKI